MLPRFWVVTPKMSFGGDMGPNMGTTVNKIACASNGRKPSHTLFKRTSTIVIYTLLIFIEELHCAA
ncbi:hypothetical protein E2C01_011885 [Portunus trituberculatus]|uniref:Uncharacterized protein n=1 Tax=Portunus trituberculatus TaxID=210409 RepID=A0A5B7DCI9_PORTR|nr:hypothetical protein [Portunus trituberculatus]